MAEGELFRDLMVSVETPLAQMFEKNRIVCQDLLVHICLTAKAWSLQRGIKYGDVQVVKQEMTPDSEIVLFQLEESEEALTNRHGGLLGADGMPIAASL